MKRHTAGTIIMRYSVIFCFVTILGATFLINACNKAGKKTVAVTEVNDAIVNRAPAPVIQNSTITQLVTVVDIRKSDDGTFTRVYFRENEEVFVVQNASVVANLQSAYSTQKVIKVTFNPWTATVLAVTNATDDESRAHNSRQIVSSPGTYQRIDIANTDPNVINNIPESAELNTTTNGLINVIPDMATAQAMFDYITHQCCAISGPYLIDHCIPFQYVIDGCYARAHKMCWILNNTYHYSTHKIFSFAFGGSYSLSVKAEKWGGCCVNWWYHVAPLVNIKTPTGVQAFVFDPGMFDQPVLLATWLHAQSNPACSGSAAVTSINIQPTSSYSPVDTAHFDTDPSYSSTNSTLMGYATLNTCH